MKSCRTCHQEIPDGLLDCRACIERKSNEALKELQLPYLRQAAEGRVQFITRRAQGSPSRHVQMFGPYLRAFCGIEISSQIKAGAIDYEPEEMNKVCSACRTEIHRLMEEARR
jgi:hypothetical protein